MEKIIRILQAQIAERMLPNKVMLIFGARLVGKTVLMKQIINDFKGKSLVMNGEDYIRSVCSKSAVSAIIAIC